MSSLECLPFNSGLVELIMLQENSSLIFHNTRGSKQTIDEDIAWPVLCMSWWWKIFGHDDVIKWKHFLRYWPFVRGINWSSVNSPHKGQWRRALMFSLICALKKRWSKQSWGWWFETPSRSSWRHCNENRFKDVYWPVVLFKMHSSHYVHGYRFVANWYPI